MESNTCGGDKQMVQIFRFILTFNLFEMFLVICFMMTLEKATRQNASSQRIELHLNTCVAEAF